MYFAFALYCFSSDRVLNRSSRQIVSFLQDQVALFVHWIYTTTELRSFGLYRSIDIELSEDELSVMEWTTFHLSTSSCDINFLDTFLYSCILRLDHLWGIRFFIVYSIMINYLLPPFLMATLGLLTIFNVRKAQRRAQPGINREYSHRKDRYLLRMLLFQVIVHVIFTIPIAVHQVENVSLSISWKFQRSIFCTDTRSCDG